MREDEETAEKPSDSYGKRFETKPKPSDSHEGTRKPRKNHQIPRGNDLKTNSKPSDSYGERLEN